VGGVEQTSNKPSGKIGAAQAFFAISTANGAVAFNNKMRVGVGGNSQFFKMNNSKGKLANTIEKNRIWLNLTNDQGAFKQTLIGYVTEATNEYEGAFDGESFDGNKYVDFYSVNNDKNLTIQGRALPFNETDIVPLGYSSAIVGSFAVGIDQVDGVLVNQTVFIEDKYSKIIHNLKEGPYNFTTEKGTFNDRFILKYTNKTLAIGDFETQENGVVISNKNKEIFIRSSDELIDKIFVYDFSGRRLYEKIKVDTNEYKIPSLGSVDQALIVKVVLQNGLIISKKIIF
jgi:hypothetical protein